MEEEKVRQLAAVMFTDIVGYTALMEGDEARAVAVRKRHREVFKQTHELHHGEIIQYYGDGTLSVFSSAIQAVECAIEIQRKLQDKDPVPVRIGLHMGDIVYNQTEIYGDSVNLASRIESMGIAGAVLISAKLNEELKNHKQIRSQSLGRFSFKNISNPVEVFVVTNEGLKIPDASELKGKQTKQSKTIAVLPFVNMSSQIENEYFSDGMTEEIINALAKIKGLKVSSRTSSFYFKNKQLPIPQIGKELNVSTILEGSIRLSGNKMRLTAQLIDVEEDFHFWSETFDRSIEDIFAVQDEISLLIADKLREHIGHFDIEDRLVDAAEIPVEIYKLYLKGRYYLMKLDLEGTLKGIAIFEEVIAAQPDFALAYLGINQGYAFLGTMGQIPAHEAFAKAQPFLEKAIALDENLPEVQLNLAWIAAWQNWDLTKAYKHINKALEIRPSDVMYLTMSNTLVVEGKFEAALTYIDKALQLDPFSPMNAHFKGFLLYLQERYEEAMVWLKKSLELQAELSFSRLTWGNSLLLKGQAKEGLQFFQDLPKDKPGDLTKTGGITLAYSFLEEIAKAEEGIAKLEAALKTDAMGSAVNFLIYCHTRLGRFEKAIQLIEEGVANRLPMMPLLYTEPLLKPLRSHPRFQSLMREVLGERTSFGGPQRKYKKSLFSEESLSQYQEKLLALMEKEKPYLDPNLSLRSLANLLEIPPNHLSQLLNQGFDKNFAEYINLYRVEAFKAKAADPTQQHLTILALAYESGFNSKTVFNTFFKKATGKTPKVYWKEVLKK